VNPRRQGFLILNLVGGIAVLASYAWGLSSRPDAGAALWAGVPENWRPLYTVNMFLAAAGYFAFTPWFLAASGRSGARFFGSVSFGAVNALYAGVLFPSALWLPLTLIMVDAPGPWIWWAIRLDLFAVGLGSLGLLAAVATSQSAGPRRWRAAAIAGLLPFCLQTAVLDALVWPWFYPR
jgi:hypothetical protein